MKNRKDSEQNTANDKYTSAYRPGENPEMDAWFTTFYIENHLDYFTHPDQAASPDQVRFMVFTGEDQRYYPCSDRMFAAIMGKNQSDFIQARYNEVLRNIQALIDRQIEDPNQKKYLEALVAIKFRHETRDEIMIPSRLEKRLMRIFLNHTQIEDPFTFIKSARNLRADSALNSEAFRLALNHVSGSDISGTPTTLTGIKGLVEHLELKRLIGLCADSRMWESDKFEKYTGEDYLRLFKRPLTGNGIDRLFEFFGIFNPDRSAGSRETRKILWMTNEAGEILVDLAIIRYLAKLGHKIIVSFKDGPLFTQVDFTDAQEDPILHRELEGALFIREKSLTKNDLLKILRSDYNIFAISDGTRESLNLLLTSTTFARIFKEVDGVISRGDQQKRRFFDTHFEFTQDIYNISSDEQGSVSICYKSKHPSVIKFSHKDLENKAKSIIDQMESAKKQGMTVVFYSGVIGSIPGKITMAKKIMSVFIDHLKKQIAMTFIINPSEYFEPGMDADDLMYMWEIVQRSGFIDIWRFQTYEDIAQSFKIMNAKVPPEWVGKDATFSTGCTKEMRIALEVQKKHPEMQIMGPAKEKFMRRDEYGIGKMYDKRFGEFVPYCPEY